MKVIDFSRILAGPYCTMILADLGAEVVKIEEPTSGDEARGVGPFLNGLSAYFASLNRGKKSAALNIKDPRGRDLAAALIARADVLVENFRPGTMDRLGLGYETVAPRNPRLIYAACSGFGQTGPYRGYAGFARRFEAYSGLTYITGEPDGTPTHPSYPIGDPISGVFGAFGILLALIHRMKHPDAPGQEIDLSCTEALLRLLEVLPIEYEQLGLLHGRTGSS
ncbi:MAG: CaiB/BaiF CoA transferase family protein, partial [Candidatus Methylomirabilales bacterium]